MNALAPVEPIPAPDVTAFAAAIAVRLADEGIPVRAIARATQLPSEQVYSHLRDAILAGHIVEMPKDDWPPKMARNARVTFNGTPLEKEEHLIAACARTFKASPLEAAILATLLRRDQASKEQLHFVVERNRATQGQEPTEIKIVDVMICKLRKKILPHNILIETMWGTGYLINRECRDVAFAILMAGL